MLKKILEDLGFQNFVRRRFLKMELAILVLASFSAPISLKAATIRVPADQITIQAAINAASNGDTVLVEPGTYFENINFVGKAITVISEQGPEVTIIDGRQLNSVVTFVSGEGRNSMLSGFTVRNGRSGFDTPGFGDGGGVRIQNSSPSISGNLIIDNKACTGVGISSRFGSPKIEGNVIRANIQFGCSGGIGGGGIVIGGNSAAEVLNNVISDNFMGGANGGGISLFAAGTPTIRGNVISGNTATGISPAAQGGGIWIVNDSDALIVQNLIVGNTAGEGAGIYWGVPFGNRGPFVVNNTIADNDASHEGSGIFASGFDAQSLLTNNIIVGRQGQTALFCDPLNDPNPPIITFNNIFSVEAPAYGGVCNNQTDLNGNISADPLFVDPTNGNYNLQPESLAIDAGDNTAPGLPATDFEGRNRIKDGNRDGIAVVDMGAFEAALPFPGFLRGSGPDANPTVLFLDVAAPTSSTAKFRDSAALKLNGGNLKGQVNPWALIGSWSPTSFSGSLSALSDLHVWLGLKNRDDTGRRFDLRVEVWKNFAGGPNGGLVSLGELFCIAELTTDPALAKEVTVPFAPLGTRFDQLSSPVSFDGINDVLSLRVFARLGTDGTESGLCGRYRNATGLRLYFDAIDRNSHFGGELD